MTKFGMQKAFNKHVPKAETIKEKILKLNYTAF